MIQKNKRHQALLALTLAATLTVLSGCAGIGAPPVSKEPVTIELWHYYNGPQQDAFNTLVQKFNDTEGQAKGIIVEASSRGNVNQLAEEILDAGRQNAGAQGIPDIFAAYSDTAFAVDELELVAPLDSYLTDTELAQFLPGYLEEGRFDKEGSLKIFPTAKSTEILYLNQTDWQRFADATGASLEALSTLEGVAQTAEAYYNWTDGLTPEPDDGKAFFGRDSMANYMLIGARQLGVELLAVQDGQVQLNLDPVVLRTLWDNFYLPYLNGYFTHFGRFRSDDIKTGDIIAQVGSTSGALYFPDKIMADDNSSYAITMLALETPRFAGSEPYAVQQGAGMVVTKSDTRTEQAAVEFLRWFTQKEQNLQFAYSAGYMPVTQEASTTRALTDYLEQHQDTGITPSLRQTMEVAAHTTETHAMYTTKAFKSGTQARDILEKSMIDQAKEDRTQVETLMAAGTDRQTAIAQFDTDKQFNDWLSSLEKSLHTVIGN